MGRTILLLRLEGPLQSWGIRARWDVRDTQPEPTKSGIIGLLGCALGYPTGDTRLETELDAGLRFGVRVESSGTILEDYQTITDFLPTAEGSYKHSGVKTASSLERLRADPNATPATILSPRFYLEDAAFLAALEEREEFTGLAARCAEAVQRPVWPLYLGRKACIPTRPIYENLTDAYNSLETALCSYPWSWLRERNHLREKPSDRLRASVEIEKGFDGDETAGHEEMSVRQDAVRINPARQYGFRRERRFWVDRKHLLNAQGGLPCSI